METPTKIPRKAPWTNMLSSTIVFSHNMPKDGGKEGGQANVMVQCPGLPEKERRVKKKKRRRFVLSTQTFTVAKILPSGDGKFRVRRPPSMDESNQTVDFKVDKVQQISSFRMLQDRMGGGRGKGWKRRRKAGSGTSSTDTLPCRECSDCTPYSRFRDQLLGSDGAQTELENSSMEAQVSRCDTETCMLGCFDIPSCLVTQSDVAAWERVKKILKEREDKKRLLGGASNVVDYREDARKLKERRGRGRRLSRQAQGAGPDGVNIGTYKVEAADVSTYVIPGADGATNTSKHVNLPSPKDSKKNVSAQKSRTFSQSPPTKDTSGEIDYLCDISHCPALKGLQQRNYPVQTESLFNPGNSNPSRISGGANPILSKSSRALQTPPPVQSFYKTPRLTPSQDNKRRKPNTPSTDTNCQEKISQTGDDPLQRLHRKLEGIEKMLLCFIDHQAKTSYICREASVECAHSLQKLSKSVVPLPLDLSVHKTMPVLVKASGPMEQPMKTFSSTKKIESPPAVDLSSNTSQVKESRSGSDQDPLLSHVPSKNPYSTAASARLHNQKPDLGDSSSKETFCLCFKRKKKKKSPPRKRACPCKSSMCALSRNLSKQRSSCEGRCKRRGSRSSPDKEVTILEKDPGGKLKARSLPVKLTKEEAELLMGKKISKNLSKIVDSVNDEYRIHVDSKTGVKTITAKNRFCECRYAGCVTNTNQMIFPSDFLERLSKNGSVDPTVLTDIAKIIGELENQKRGMNDLKEMLLNCFDILRNMDGVRIAESPPSPAGGDYVPSKEMFFPVSRLESFDRDEHGEEMKEEDIREESLRQKESFYVVEQPVEIKIENKKKKKSFWSKLCGCCKKKKKKCCKCCSDSKKIERDVQVTVQMTAASTTTSRGDGFRDDNEQFIDQSKSSTAKVQEKSNPTFLTLRGLCEYSHMN